MPSLKTEVTEIVTGLGMLGYASLADALRARPPEMVNVGTENWKRIQSAFASGHHAGEFFGAWGNGIAFLSHSFGLRERRPLRIEWKGPHRPPGYELIPVDLRIDHAFLVSCKYKSRVLFNPSPSHLFDRCLANRYSKDHDDWYLVVAHEAYQRFYEVVRTELDSHDLPNLVGTLTRVQRDYIGEITKHHWPTVLGDAYRVFCAEVSAASSLRWSSRLDTPAAQEEMFWRLLRICSAPYFILGTSGNSSMRMRIETPWDWRQRFSLKQFSVNPDLNAGQPLVRWCGVVRCLDGSGDRTVAGHVEVRWSHGRFCGNPEAKVYLDTPHEEVPGYVTF